MNKAKFVKRVEGWRGDARLYELDKPVQYDSDDDEEICETKYIIVSAVVASFSGPETYIFPATKDGDAISMLEMEGSFQGGLDHKAALEGAGITLEEQ